MVPKVTVTFLLFGILLDPVSMVSAKRPNILILIADDLGIGDIGCFGNRSLRTPNIDRLSLEGAKLTHHLAAASICTPSRAAFLTGRYPIRLGMTSPSALRAFAFLASSGGLPENETTFAELAKAAGYKTALIGKWHLGWSRDRWDDFHHHPNRHGFDYFYGLPLSNVKDFGNEGDSIMLSMTPSFHFQLATVLYIAVVSSVLLYKTDHIKLPLLITIAVLCVSYFGYLFFTLKMFTLLNSFICRNVDVVEHPVHLETLSKKLVIEGQEFLEERREDNQPFLLMMSWILPHTYLASVDQFAGKSQHGKYGDAIEELDWSVGEILNTLERLRLSDNTFVYFTSDHGGHLEERNIRGELEGGFNGIYRGGKGHGAPDGAIRVPTILRWPNHVTPGSTIDEPTSLMDMLPTLTQLMGSAPPGDRIIDGKNLLPLLTEQTLLSPHEFMFHYCGDDVHAVRYRPRTGHSVWKLVFKEPNYFPGTQEVLFIFDCMEAVILDPPVLFDMTVDSGESNPIIVNEHFNIYKTIMKALAEHRKSLDTVPNQLTFTKRAWRPWLQPCCNNNYPTCACEDIKFKGKL